ncbi:MAG: RNA recognition motif domain-containing protein [Nannocystaceae bacterium]
MSRTNYSAGKHQREAEKAKKKREKAERRRRKREQGAADVPVASAEEIQVAAHTEQAQPRTERKSRSVPCRLFVGGLAWETDQATLREAFAKHGDVLEASIILDREGRSRGFGFVTMADNRAARTAMAALNGSDLDGRMLKVSPATER